MPQVRVLRPFMNGSHHVFVGPGDVIQVDDDRATELRRNHLVEVIGAEKAAPAAAIKPAATPKNKVRQRSATKTNAT